MPPSLRSFDLNLLVLFDALFEERKLQTAARRIGLSQPAASQSLSRLRKAFDDELFVRRPQGMVPTARAVTLAPMVREALRAVERGLTALQSFDPSTSEREFKLALADAGEIVTLPAIVVQLTRLAPNLQVVSVRGSRSEVEQMASSREVDLALDFEPPKSPLMRSALIAEEDLVVIARREHPRVRATPTIAAFLAEKHVVVNFDPALIHRLGAQLSATALLERRILCRCVHVSAVPAVVMETDALALVPRAIVMRAPYAGQLQVLEPPIETMKIPLFAWWHSSLDADPGHLWLRSQLVRPFWAS
ncbi:MAG: LysR substrate-binding domain-containing protein [Myxococcaceae bacterium]|nr:LysR substrate-binding domain-containing protein [Myxococcaceae bacterium]